MRTPVSSSLQGRWIKPVGNRSNKSLVFSPRQPFLANRHLLDKHSQQNGIIVQCSVYNLLSCDNNDDVDDDDDVVMIMMMMMTIMMMW